MKSRSRPTIVTFLVGVLAVFVAGLAFASDSHTVALWLFDERQYPYTTLTDAGNYQADLRLEGKGQLVPGRFGNALKVTPASGYNLYFAEWMGSVTLRFMRGPDGQPSGLWGPTITPGNLLSALAGNEWTWEFWLKLASVSGADVSIMDLGYAYDPGLACYLSAGAASFKLTNYYGGYAGTCPTAALSDDAWHHVAFIRAGGQIKHFIDGQQQATATLVGGIPVQPVPPTIYPPSLALTTYGIFDASKDYERFRSNRVNLSIGQNRRAAMKMDGLFDEMRISSVARYTSKFALPAGFSRNYGPYVVQPAVPTGSPLLFSGTPVLPVALGSRKHLFIDEVMVQSKTNVQLVVNGLTNAVPIRVEGRSPVDVVGDLPFVDHDGKVCLVYYDGNDSEEGKTSLFTSTDGLTFTKPSIGLISYAGSTNNNYVMYRVCIQGRAIKDLNPFAPAEERFKICGNLANGGIYLYTSPDLIHWRRGETIMLPLMTGGGQEMYWDDQRGRYAMILKRDSSFCNSEAPCQGGHTGIGFAATELTKPWPFHAMATPYFEGWPITDVSGEGQILFGVTTNGGVYRSRATKYAWAPDAYVAFIWRYQSSGVRQTQLAVSRDGDTWTVYPPPAWYLPNGFVVAGKTVAETLMQDGMIRRGNEIWHYAQYVTGPHGSGDRFHVRLVQRLDGFTSLDAGATMGTVITKPLVFSGSKLELNIAPGGVARVALLDPSGAELPGFGLADCDPITDDSLSHRVSWQGSQNCSSVAGVTLRLKFQLQNAKLYAFQFVD